MLTLRRIPCRTDAIMTPGEPDGLRALCDNTGLGVTCLRHRYREHSKQPMKWFMQLISLFPVSRPMAAKIASFATIGVGNTLVDFAVFTFAYKVLELALPLSNVLSWLIAVSGSYVMNSLITFHAESGRALNRKGYFTFVASGIVGVIASTIAIVVLSYFMPVIPAKLGSIAVSFVVNFTMAHFVVFRAKAPDES
jgi:putative flippase GtrA